MKTIALLPIVSGILLSFISISAQVKPKDPMDEIVELFKKTKAELSKIDDLLLKLDLNGSKGSSGAKKEIKEAEERQLTVIKTIDEILRKLPSSNNKSSSGNPNSNSNKNKNDKKQNNKPKPGKREKKPDLVKKDGQKGKKKGDKKKTQPSKPKNRKGKKPLKNPAGSTPRQGGTEAWGNLPPYLQKIFKAGHIPKIPEKYLPFWKAFKKSNKEKNR